MITFADRGGAWELRRCMGVATPLQVNIIRQASPLRVEHLLALHHVLDSDEDPWNICFAGMALF